MPGPDRAIVGRAQAAMGDEGVALREPLRFDEEFVEGGMRAIGPVRREREFEVAG